MNVDTWAVVFATLFGPIFAVQAQQIVARRGERRQRQLALFRSLMNTRVAAALARGLGVIGVDSSPPYAEPCDVGRILKSAPERVPGTLCLNCRSAHP